jgi:hypothetical protein
MRFGTCYLKAARADGNVIATARSGPIVTGRLQDVPIEI